MLLLEKCHSIRERNENTSNCEESVVSISGGSLLNVTLCLPGISGSRLFSSRGTACKKLLHK